MLFETKLEELTTKYNIFPPSPEDQQAMTQLLEETFQANSIKYNKAADWGEQTSCKIGLPAPGLGTYSGMSGTGWIPEAVTYHSKNEQPALPPAENGWLRINLIYEGKRGRPQTEEDTLRKIDIDFSAYMPFPQFDQHADKNRRRYKYETKNGKFSAWWDEDIQAEYRTKNITEGTEIKEIDGKWNVKIMRISDYLINIKQLGRGGKMTGMSFKPEILKEGILSDFFEDIGYTGLDRLF